jgi:hypothetical protein
VDEPARLKGSRELWRLGLGRDCGTPFDPEAAEEAGNLVDVPLAGWPPEPETERAVEQRRLRDGR